MGFSDDDLDDPSSKTSPDHKSSQKTNSKSLSSRLKNCIVVLFSKNISTTYHEVHWLCSSNPQEKKNSKRGKKKVLGCLKEGEDEKSAMLG